MTGRSLVRHFLTAEHSWALRHDWPVGHVVDDRVALADVRRDPVRVAAINLTEPPPRVDRRHLEWPACMVKGRQLSALVGASEGAPELHCVAHTAVALL